MSSSSTAVQQDKTQLAVLRGLLKNGAAAALAASIAEVATIPFDTVKVRLQMQNTA